MIVRTSRDDDYGYICDMRKSVYGYDNLPGGTDGTYLVAERDGVVEGFIYIRFGRPYEWQRHVNAQLDEDMYEVGRLAVKPDKRNAGVAKALIHGSKMWCMARNWSTKFCIFATHHMVETYKTYNITESEISSEKGVLMFGDTTLKTYNGDCEFKISIHSTHGGGSFEKYDTVPNSIDTVPADVLDAWFAPPSDILDLLSDPFVTRSSPPTSCTQIVNSIRKLRNISSDRCIVPGAGSSDIIFRALPLWISKDSNVLVLNPTYSEYPHILKNVIGCRVKEVSEDDFEQQLTGVDWVCIVNPNSPTGSWKDLTDIVKSNPGISFWVDETYVDLAGKPPMEGICLNNLYVCKSMSKSYGISGLRAAYITGPNDFRMERLKLYTPPWVMSYHSQIVASRVLERTDYYTEKWRVTQDLKSDVIKQLEKFYVVHEGCANFYTIEHEDPEYMYTKMKEQGIFIRRIQGGIRIAVRDVPENEKIVRALLSLKNTEMS